MSRWYWPWNLVFEEIRWIHMQADGTVVERNMLSR